MRTKFFMIAVFLLLFTMPTLAQNDIAEWTYMQYFAMDNNLEAQVYGDLAEMQAVGSTDDVHMVAQVDRIEGFEDRFGDWTGTRRFYLTHETQTILTPEQKIEELLLLIYAQPGVDRESLRAELRNIHDTDPAAYANLLTSAGVDPNDTAFIDKIVEARGLGLQFSTEPLADLGEVNMGDPAALVDFVTWAIENYPAKKYALTISTHGAGWLGNGPDETDGHDQLQLPEIVQALDQIRAQTGVEQLDLIGFDACLMGQLEVYRALAPYTPYILAAEEIIPGQGWEYTTPFTQLTENPTMSAAELGANIVDAYMAYYAGPGARTKVDLHLIDTSKIPAVVEALAGFADAADQNTADKLSSLGVARINAQLFAADSGDALGTGSSSAIYSSVDLVSFMELIAGQGDIDPDLGSAARAVSEGAQAAVIHGSADDYLPDAHGISIFFPTNANAAELPLLVVNDLIAYPTANPEMSKWNEFLSTFHQTIATALLPENLKINITQMLPAENASIYDPPVVVFDTDGEGIAKLTFTAVLRLEDGTQVMVDYSPIVFESVLPDGRTVRTFPTGVSEGNSFAWNVETLMISDGATQIPATLFINSVGISQGAVSGTYVSQAGNEVAASVIFDINTWRALSTYGTSEDGATSEITPQPGDKFFPNWYFVTDQGLSATRATDSLVYGVNPFTYDFVPAASGNYRLTMILEDLAGNVSVSSADVIVDNTGLDTTYRGYKDIYTGINFLYPWGWSDPTQLADESGQVDQIVITNPDGDIRVYIAMRDQDIDTAAQDMIDLELSLPDAELVDPLQPYEDDPATAQFFTYSYSDEGEARVGMVIIVRVEDNAATYTFDIDAPEAKGDEALAIVQKMAESITFFSPLE